MAWQRATVPASEAVLPRLCRAPRLFARVGRHTPDRSGGSRRGKRPFVRERSKPAGPRDPRPITRSGHLAPAWPKPRRPRRSGQLHPTPDDRTTARGRRCVFHFRMCRDEKLRPRAIEPCNSLIVGWAAYSVSASRLIKLFKPGKGTSEMTEVKYCGWSSTALPTPRNCSVWLSQKDLEEARLARSTDHGGSAPGPNRANARLFQRLPEARQTPRPC